MKEIFKVKEEFSALKDFIINLPHSFDRIGLIIQDNRNVIKKITIPQGTFVVKDFRGMYFFNRLAYSLFRQSKAERSYNYSATLNEKGIITPPHVAWINCYTFGLLSKSYFVSLYYSYKTLREVLDENKENESYRISLLHHLAAFTRKLHDLGIYHYDYSLGNILVIPTQNSFDFALVDLNRISFKKVSYRKGLWNFTTLGISTEDMNVLIREYAILSKQSPEESIALFWKHKKQTSSLRKFRKDIRRFTLAPLERLTASSTTEMRQSGRNTHTH